ncbi:MAG: alpha/beta fold hydrolase [Chthonomonadaceae bacterium]|nr:alpha/beta fold hydrolase [Chthonomonadaceae bacterium]
MIRQAGLGATVTAVSMATCTLVCAYLALHPPRRPVTRPDDLSTGCYESVCFLARDGIPLSGWFCARPGASATIILCHGYPANRSEMLGWARLFGEAGFHTLLFDFRAMGESGGNRTSIGLQEVQDLLGAVDFVASRPETAGHPIGVYGFSMGGAVAIMAAAQEARIAAVATHGAYATLERAIHQRGRMILGPIGRIFSAPAVFWMQQWLGEHPRRIAPVDQVARIAPRPLFLSHGTEDPVVHPEDARILFRAARPPKLLRLLPRSRHAWIDPAVYPAYRQELTRFFKEAFRA